MIRSFPALMNVCSDHDNTVPLMAGTFIMWSVVAERPSASDSSSGVVRMWDLNPGLAGHGVCVLKQDT